MEEVGHTGKAGLQYEFHRNLQAYATYTRGYKGIGYNMEAGTDFAHQAFGSRRKKLLNNLLAMFPSHSRQQMTRILEKANVPPDARPENLAVTEFHRLYNEIMDVKD